MFQFPFFRRLTENELFLDPTWTTQVSVFVMLEGNKDWTLDLDHNVNLLRGFTGNFVHLFQSRVVSRRVVFSFEPAGL